MIRDKSVIRTDYGRRHVRPEGPAVSLPHPHFDATQIENVLGFLDLANQRLLDPETSHESVGRTIWDLCGVLHQRRATLSRKEWKDLIPVLRKHPILATLHEDAFTSRSFNKPRGYAGDAKLLDYMYGVDHQWSLPEMTAVGKRIFRWSTLSSACIGVRERRAIIADQIDELAKRRSRPSILSLASGHFREAEFSTAVLRRKLGKAVAIDSDEESLRTVERDYLRYGIQTIHASARELITGKLKVGNFDLIYSSGLCDYLSDSMCQRLAENLFTRLNPGGRLLLTNFVDNIEAVGYMEYAMDWNLIYRNRQQMMGMTARIPDRLIDRITVFSEENHNVLFVSIDRAG